MAITIDDYPYRPRPRRFHSRIRDLIAAREDSYRKVLQSFLALRSELERIPVEPVTGNPELPHWNNHWLPALDAVSLYGIIATRRPRSYVEIGSGNSTKFARLSIRNNHLDTRLISIDPNPRAEIDPLCDVTIRSPLEDADLSIFRTLGPRDIVFVDSSHRAFQNSDVTVFFTEILPDLPRGTMYGIHDIFLPFDYGQSTLSPDWPSEELSETHLAIATRFEAFLPRFYNEQYLLASYLLGGAGQDRIVLPCAWVSSQYHLANILVPIWRAIGFQSLSPWGGAFWAERGTAALRRRDLGLRGLTRLWRI